MEEIYEPAEDSYLLSRILEKEIPKIIKKKPNAKFLEIGCGSGIQLMTALKIGIKKENIFGVDINPFAVEQCKSMGFNCLESDLFKEVYGTYDIIIFNPPYLPENKNEPKESRLATTGGKEGGELINDFLEQAKNHLEEKGVIFLLTSSLTNGVNFIGYKKKILGKEKIFFEELFVWKLEKI